MHILLIEVSLSGHHSIYLERTALAYINAGNKVTIALPVDVKNMDVLRSNLSNYSKINWHEYSFQLNLNRVGVLGLIEREYSVRKLFGLIYSEVNLCMKIDYVFLPYIDYCLYAIGLMGSPFGATKFGGICMRPSFHYKSSGVVAPNGKIDVIKKYIFYRLLRNKKLKKLFSIDELLVSSTQHNARNPTNCLEYLHDPVDDPVEVDVMQVRTEFGVSASNKTILVYGALDQRKGIVFLLDSLEREKEAKEWHVWLIGRQGTVIREMLIGDRWSKLKQQERVQIYDEFVSKKVEQNVFSACDMVWIGYREHYGMSGVLVHAALHKKPVIACKEGLIGWYTKKYNMGITIDFNSDYGKCITDYLLSISLKQIGVSSNFPASRHSWTAFSEQIIRAGY